VRAGPKAPILDHPGKERRSCSDLDPPKAYTMAGFSLALCNTSICKNAYGRALCGPQVWLQYLARQRCVERHLALAEKHVAQGNRHISEHHRSNAKQPE
jgi:hypothetical protein